MKIDEITLERLRASLAALGYAFFEKGEFNLNIIGIRTADKASNSFNDWLAVAYKERSEWQLKIYSITTDPGLYYRTHPMNIHGTAILVPGQHRGAYQLGKHRGRYDALVQRLPLPVYRDNNGDETLDFDGKVQDGYHGINHHRASEKWESKQVGKWSAGCQVHANPFNYDYFIQTCRRSQKLWGNAFTYTLLTEEQFLNG